MGKNDSYEFGGLLNMKGVYFNWDVWLVRNEVYTKDILGDGKYKRATYPESKFYVYSKNGAKNLINTFKSKNIKPNLVIDESFMKRIEYKFESKDDDGYTIVFIEPTQLRKFVDSEDLGTLTNDYFTFERKNYAKGGNIDGFDETYNRFADNIREAFGQPRKNNIVRLESDFGFKKSELPQLRTKDKPMFVKSLISKYGANVLTEGLKVKASQLKPIQNEINLEQVEVISNVSKGKMNPNKPITISQDGYVIDGHHRWYYAKQNDLKLSVLQINLSAMQVIDEIWQSGLAKKEDISSVRMKQGGQLN